MQIVRLRHYSGQSHRKEGVIPELISQTPQRAIRTEDGRNQSLQEGKIGKERPKCDLALRNDRTKALQRVRIEAR